MELQIKEGMETLMSNFCLISHCCYIVEKLTVLDSSNLNLTFFQGHSKKFCVKKMKEKCVTFCFIKLNAKIPPKSLGEGDFSVQTLGLFFQSYYLFRLFPAEVVAMS